MANITFSGLFDRNGLDPELFVRTTVREQRKQAPAESRRR